MAVLEAPPRGPGGGGELSLGNVVGRKPPQPGFKRLAADAVDQQRFRSQREEQAFGLGIVGTEGLEAGQIPPAMRSRSRSGRAW